MTITRTWTKTLAAGLLAIGLVAIPATQASAQGELDVVVEKDDGEDNTGLWGLLGLLGLIGLAGLSGKKRDRHVDVHRTEVDPNRPVDPNAPI